MRLPPKLAGYSGLAAHKLNLEAAFDDLVATKPLAIDFIQLVPADGWRVLEAIAHVWPTNYRLADDGINGDIWLDNGAGAERTGAWVGTGKAIELQPGKDQRLYFLTHADVSDTAPINMKLSVKLFYRPRRRTL